RRAEMVDLGTNWVGRNAPDLSMREEAGTWKVFDGKGLTYTFTQHVYLAGTGGPYAGQKGLWLLDSIQGPGGALVKLTYDIGLVDLPNSPTIAGYDLGITIDLVRVSYNPHPSASCFKHEVSLHYDSTPLIAAPQSLTIMGERVI